MFKGWECPKCGKVYAPWVRECNKCPEIKIMPGNPKDDLHWDGTGEPIFIPCDIISDKAV